MQSYHSLEHETAYAREDWARKLHLLYAQHGEGRHVQVASTVRSGPRLQVVMASNSLYCRRKPLHDHLEYPPSTSAITVSDRLCSIVVDVCELTQCCPSSVLAGITSKV